MAASSLRKYVYISIIAAITTISIKFAAYLITNSVGLLSDALESCVNLVAAVVALIMLTLAEKPPDKKHEFGHNKAEYFSSAIEGGLIVLAAFSIIWSAVPRIIHPQPLENLGAGILVAVGASLINLAVSIILVKNGKKNNSITLEADGKHLMTDVITSGGVLLGIALVKLTGWLFLDAIVAIGVAINIIRTGYQLMRRFASGLFFLLFQIFQKRTQFVYVICKFCRISHRIVAVLWQLNSKVVSYICGPGIEYVYVGRKKYSFAFGVCNKDDGRIYSGIFEYRT